jgi:hypothetical protein
LSGATTGSDVGVASSVDKEVCSDEPFGFRVRLIEVTRPELPLPRRALGDAGVGGVAAEAGVGCGVGLEGGRVETVERSGGGGGIVVMSGR